MPAPILFAAMLTLMPASSEVDMQPTLAPAIIVEEAASTGTSEAASTEFSTLPEVAAPVASGSSNELGDLSLEPALVLDSAQ